MRPYRGFSLLTCILPLLGGCARLGQDIPEAPKCAKPTSKEGDTGASERIAEQIFNAYRSHKPDEIVSLFSDELRVVAPASRLLSMMQRHDAEKGRFISSHRTDTKRLNYEWISEKGIKTKVIIALGDDGRVSTFRIVDEEPIPVVEKGPPIGFPLRRPFFVYWGGDRKEVNHHVDDLVQRRAADLEVRNAEGSSHSGAGKVNSDYFVFGAEVVAVETGVVVEVVDGTSDNEPGTLNEYVVTGNYVTLKHGDKLFSSYAHLRPKVPVRVGQSVKRGEIIGHVGNTGRSSEPHLHFQLQDKQDWNDGSGIEPQFLNAQLERDGKRLSLGTYTFLRGDTIFPR